MKHGLVIYFVLMVLLAQAYAEDTKPYDRHCTERENVFAFSQRPQCQRVGNDRYEISFIVKGYCDVTVGIVDHKGVVVRHVASGVLGRNAPTPFQKDSLKQKIYWDGKDDLQAYVKDIGKLRVRVMLGLKPEFDKRLGGVSPKNIPGWTWSLAIGPEAAYVFYKGASRDLGLRKFSRDGKYLGTLVPPPANLPKSKLKGLGNVTYEKGKVAIHGVDMNVTVSNEATVLPGCDKGMMSSQVALVGERLYYTNSGSNTTAGNQPSMMYYIYKDGGTDVQGLKGLSFFGGSHRNARLVGSPDGKWLYGSGTGNVIVRRPADGKGKASVFAGKGAPGSSNGQLNNPGGLDCDAQGRVYVADQNNGRVQVFSPEGKFVTSLKMDRPSIVRVHQKTGAIYVKHRRRVKGKTVDRITKYSALPEPKAETYIDGYPAGLMCVDSWSDKPRLWLAGNTWDQNLRSASGGPGVTVWEEQGKTWKKILDFRKEAKRKVVGGWSGNGIGKTEKVNCDPVRETVYYCKSKIFDLKSGKHQGNLKLTLVDDIAFDKQGYMHVHFNPGFYIPGVGRVDPDRSRKGKDRDGHEKLFYPEVPYDYGIQKMGPWKQGWKGILPVKDQQGAKFFQDGLGVNMGGDIAVESNIYYVPKMEAAGIAEARAGINARLKKGEYYDNGQASRWERHLAGLKKRGESIFSIKRRPGVPLLGGTIWTFDRTGELHKECAALVGDIVNNAQIDEALSLYFVTARPRIFDPKDVFFLAGKGGKFGQPDAKSNPFTGTLIKTKPDTYCRVRAARSVIQMDPLPTRPPDLMATSYAYVTGKQHWAWVDGHEWLYAGASPIVSVGCSCPTQRMHLDWYKRSFVPEAYRHSIGVLDTNGNLVLHIGQYGNIDSLNGIKSKVPVGGDQIGTFVPRMISGTDNYLVFEYWGEALVVLKLGYHAEETVSIKLK